LASLPDLDLLRILIPCAVLGGLAGGFHQVIGLARSLCRLAMASLRGGGLHPGAACRLAFATAYGRQKARGSPSGTRPSWRTAIIGGRALFATAAESKPENGEAPHGRRLERYYLVAPLINGQLKRTIDGNKCVQNAFWAGDGCVMARA